MNRLTAWTVVSSLHPGCYQRVYWQSEDVAIVTFSLGRARDTVADFGLSSFDNSGREIEERVRVTDRQALRALRRLQRPD